MTPFHRNHRSALIRLRAAVLLAVTVGLAQGCSDGDPRSASWSYISAAIVEPNCATVSCHSRAAAVAGLDFSDPSRGFTSLTGLWIWIVDPTMATSEGCRSVNGTVVCQRDHRSLVVPYDPAQSRLIHMLRAQGAARMPPDRPLAEGDIRLVEKWILAGAKLQPGDATDVPAVDASQDGPSDGGAAPPSLPPPTVDATRGDAEGDVFDAGAAE